jgi:hypothetical protein
MAEPARPVIINADRTGESSRVSARATVAPSMVSRLNLENMYKLCRVKTAPVNTPVSMMMKSDPGPMKSICRSTRPARKGGLKVYKSVCRDTSTNSPSPRTSRTTRPATSCFGGITASILPRPLPVYKDVYSLDTKG